MRVLLMLMTTWIANEAVQIPEVFKLCARDDSNLNSCLKQNVQLAVENLGKGLPEFNIQQLDPYLLKNIKIEYKNGLIFNRASFESFNTTTAGMSTSLVKAVRMNLQNDSMELEIDMSNKHIYLQGFYRGEVGIQSLTMRTQSHFSNKLSDVKWTWKIFAEKKTINGKTHLSVKKFRMRPVVGNMLINFDGTSGNIELVKIAQEVFQVYWREIYQEFLPIIEKTWNRIGVRVCNKVFHNIPYEELFPMSLKK